ncbi:MAG: FKBP-type peptidyl-prolyl cis-trans isomerase [Parcubacteria group bacterium]|nr:FKBP-type peptidyl-prolyl cis-trans isomerase [Parcubacteria group bacterium]
MKKLGKNEKTAVFVSLAVILFFFAAASVVGFVSKGRIADVDNENNSASLGELTVETQKAPEIIDINGMKIVDTIVGTGEEAVAGKVVTVHYTGTLTDGTKFDSSVDRGQPFQFVLGAGQVIQGWEQGFAGMKVGGKRSLMIPANMAYGDRAIGAIPANSTLLFDVELLAVDSQ